ncbi:MAG TPA: hypothetical protein VGL91_13300 [Acidobacteriota bacterium]
MKTSYAVVKDQKILAWFQWSFFVVALVVFYGCNKGEQAKRETIPPQAAQRNQAITAQQKPDASKFPPPTLAEARAAIARVFQKVIELDTGRSPNFIVGDFNNDASQDIAVVVKPAKGMLAEINSEVANWIRVDPLEIAPPEPGKKLHQFPTKPGPVRVREQDVLLAVIHGYGREGWRNPDAKQTYLLRNAVGSNLKIQRRQDLLRSTEHSPKASGPNGDVIGETLAGEPGVLYWTGAKYAWYSLVKPRHGVRRSEVKLPS